MTTLVIGLTLFFTAWLAHLVWWRIKLPKHHSRTIVLIFLASPVLEVGLAVAMGMLRSLGTAEWVTIALFHLGATGCYLIVYTGVEETSPSVAIMRVAEAAGPQGATLLQLHSAVTNEEFLIPRIEALVRDGFIEIIDETYRPTARGRSAARIAILVGKVFNLGTGA